MLMKQIRKKTYLQLGLLTMMAGAVMLSSCATDSYDEETFVSTVKNQQLLSPLADSILVQGSSDGSQTTITWPAVMGARGYDVKIYDITSETPVVLVDSIIDGCSVTTKRAEDCNYRLSIRTLANTSNGNKDAETTTEKLFNSFSPTFRVVPDGSDLYQYFQENPLPEDPSGEELCFDLAPGGNYTVSKTVDFGGKRVTLRSTSKTNYANITMQQGSTFTTFAAFGMKYINIEASDLNHSILTMSEEPDDSIKNLIGTNNYYFVMEPIVFQNCNIQNLGTSLISTNSTKYNLRTLTINNCFIELGGNAVNSSAFVYIKAGYVTDFTFKNSTLSSPTKSEKFFVQHGGRPKDVGDTELRYTTITNSTIANIAWNKNFCDYHNGQVIYYYTLLNSIIVNCGKINFVTGLNKGQSSNNPKWNINNNTYWRDGADVSASQTGVPSIGEFLTEDPGIDPENHSFKPSAAQIAAGQGDPRWYE